VVSSVASSVEIQSHLRLMCRALLLARARRVVLGTPQQLRRLEQPALVLPPLLLRAHLDAHQARGEGLLVRFETRHLPN
jgi:hypothetical protein